MPILGLKIGETVADNEDEDDMFADDDEFEKKEKQRQLAYSMNRNDSDRVAKNLPMSVQPVDLVQYDSWDDSEGYYIVIPGEVLENRYVVQSSLGKGMFSTVVKALDNKDNRYVAIKIIRRNETM